MSHAPPVTPTLSVVRVSCLLTMVDDIADRTGARDSEDVVATVLEKINGACMSLRERSYVGVCMCGVVKLVISAFQVSKQLDMCE